MNYAFMANLSFNTATKRNSVYTKIETFLANKPVWGSASLTKGVDLATSNPSIFIEIRFTERPNMDNIFNLVKTELNKLTGVKATFTKHICNHDTDNKPCVIEELATVVR